jgi:hypothetical protein
VADSNTSNIFACLRQIDADPKTSAMEFRLAYVLSQMLNKKTRQCFPLQATLAKRLGVTDRTVRQCLAGLVERGHVRVRRRGGDNSAIYEFVISDRKHSSGLGTLRPEAQFRSENEEIDSDRKSDVIRPEVKRVQTGSTLPIEPPSEPPSEPTSKNPLSGNGGIPPPTAIADSMITRAHERAGWDSARSRSEFEKFRNWQLSKGRNSHDWDAEFALWIERGLERKSRTEKVQVIDEHGNQVEPPPKRRGRMTNTERLMAGRR